MQPFCYWYVPELQCNDCIPNMVTICYYYWYVIKAFTTVYCKSFKVEKFCGFCRLIGKHETFTVKYFHLVLKMANQIPGSSLKNSCDLLSALGKASGTMLPFQNY